MANKINLGESAQFRAAVQNLKNFGVTPINPPLFAELLAAGELDSEQPTNETCRECGTKLYQVDIDTYGNRCGSCAWFEGMANV